jgi:hypothetical protein
MTQRVYVTHHQRRSENMNFQITKFDSLPEENVSLSHDRTVMASRVNVVHSDVRI